MKNSVEQSWKNTLRTFMGFGKEDNFFIMAQIAQSIASAFIRGNKVFVAGNGGSSCDAMHFAQEFTGKFRLDRKALPVISFDNSAHITCVGNDYGFENIFSRELDALGVAGDIFVAISTSGNSGNLIKAVHKAKEKKIIVVSLLGRDGGKIKGLSDYEICVQGDTSDKIQEVHMSVLHIIIESVEAILYKERFI